MSLSHVPFLFAAFRSTVVHPEPPVSGRGMSVPSHGTVRFNLTIALLMQGYVEYSYLKKRLKELAAARERLGPEPPAPRGPTGSVTTKSHPVVSPTGEDFNDLLKEWSQLLEIEREKVDKFTEAKVEELKITISLISRKCATASLGDVDRLLADTDETCEVIVQLEQ